MIPLNAITRSWTYVKETDKLIHVFEKLPVSRAINSLQHAWTTAFKLVRSTEIEIDIVGVCATNKKTRYTICFYITPSLGVTSDIQFLFPLFLEIMEACQIVWTWIWSIYSHHDPWVQDISAHVPEVLCLYQSREIKENTCHGVEDINLALGLNDQWLTTPHTLL